MYSTLWMRKHSRLLGKHRCLPILAMRPIIKKPQAINRPSENAENQARYFQTACLIFKALKTQTLNYFNCISIQPCFSTAILFI